MQIGGGVCIVSKCYTQPTEKSETTCHYGCLLLYENNIAKKYQKVISENINAMKYIYDGKFPNK